MSNPPPSPVPASPGDPTGGSKSGGSNTGLVVIIVILILLVAGIGGYFLFKGAQDSAPEPGNIAVPSVVGANVDSASSQLESAGLVVGKIETEPSDIAEGTVLTQDPESGTMVAAGTKVKLTVAGPPEPKVPSVVGMDQAAAENALIEAGLVVGKVSTEPSSQAVGTVIGQDPDAGTQLAKDSAVNLTVSNGKTEVPDVLGLTEARATAKLQDAGFLVQSQAAKPDAGKKGTVVKTNPAAGKFAEMGSTVVISVVPE